MDQYTQSQTSFIPRKSLAKEGGERETKNVGLFAALPAVIFFIALASSGGLYLYKYFLNNSIVEKSTSLERAKNAFEPALIVQLKNLNSRIESSGEIISNHTIVSPIFSLLEESTLKTIRYNSFDYSYKKDDKKLMINLAGEASSYSSIVLQSDSFSKNKFVKSNVFSGLNLNDRGYVTFKLEMELDPKLISYEANVTQKENIEKTNLINE